MSEDAFNLPESLAEFVEPEQESKPVEPISPEANPLEDKARSMGWMPKEEFTGDHDQWVDAKEFVGRKPIFDQIHALKKQLKEKEQQINGLSSFAANAAKKAREQAIAEIQERRKEAFESGNFEHFDQADRALRQVEVEQFQQQPKGPEIPEDVAEFAGRNSSWFEKDRAMTAYAVDLCREYVSAGMSRPDALKKVEQDVRKEFSHKFVNPNKGKPAAVAPDGDEKRPAGKITYNDLTPQERSVWRALQQKTDMKFDEFIKDLR